MADLLTRVAKGEPGAVAACIDRYGGPVHALACRWLGRAEADDATQTVFIALWRAAPRFDPARAGEQTFVWTVARRQLIDLLRSKPRTTAVSLEAPETPEPADRPVQDLLERGDEVARVRACLDRLPIDRREALRLVLVEGCTHAEAADLPGLPLGTVKTHIRKGLCTLRERLGSEPEGSP